MLGNTGPAGWEHKGTRRGTVTVKDGKLCLSALNRDSDRSDELVLSKPDSESFAQFLHSFLQQKARLYVSPPNKAHITIDGCTIGHTKATGPTDRIDGSLRYKTDTQYEDPRGNEKQADIDPRNIAIPLACFTDRVLPNTPTCPHCINKADALDLITTPDTSSHRPGTSTPDCPRCGNPCQFEVSSIGNRPEIAHAHPDEIDCPTIEDGYYGKIDRKLTDAEIAELTEHRVGLHNTPYTHGETTQIDIPTPLPGTTTDLHLHWIRDADVPYQVTRQLRTDADTKTRPDSILIVNHTSLNEAIALLFRDWTDIIDFHTTTHDTTSPDASHTIPPEHTLLETCNTIPRTSPAGNSPTSDLPPVSTKQLLQSLTPIPLTNATTDHKYTPETVREKINEFTTDDGTYDRSAIEIEPLAFMQREEDIHSRHYHQRLLNYNSDTLNTITSRLDISPSDSTILIFGGFTGEFAAALGELGAEIIFTDPMDAWTTAAAENPHIDRTVTTQLDAIPGDLFAEADAVATFECYYGITAGPQKSLYNILRTAETEHGLLFALSRPTQEQMEAKTGNQALTEFRSDWGIFEEIYDMTIQWRQADEIRVWQLKPPRTGDQAIVTDRLTIQALTQLADSMPSNSTSSEPTDVIPLADAYPQLTDIHPLLTDHDAIAQSIGRLGTIYQSSFSAQSSTPRDRLGIGDSEFRMNGPEEQYIDRTH